MIIQRRFGSSQIAVNWFPLMILAMALSAGVMVRQAPAATAAQITDAINRGKQYLYSRQVNGNWESTTHPRVDLDYPNDPVGLQYGGMTAIATFALLSCGEDPQSNDHLKQAVAFLEKANLRGTYAVGLRSQIWNLLPDDSTVKQMRRRDKETLLDGVLQAGDAGGMFNYGDGMDRRLYDHSVSQFAVLGLWAATEGGEEVQTSYWRAFDRAWRSQQRPSGAWCYLAKPLPAKIAEKSSPGMGGELLSMTAAGVATLFITQDFVSGGARCEGNIKDPNITAGMRWISSHLDSFNANEWSQLWRYYTLFGICRIGQASGYKYIGDTDWFQWGSDALVKEQAPAGSWGAGRLEVNPDTQPMDNSVYNTAFSLLFLSRGRAPVLFNKLQYNILKSGTDTVEANWNQRPRDVANLTHLLAKESEAQLNWQIVNLHEQAADLIDAPLLYIAGDQLLKLTPADTDKLKEYIEEGGIIVGHADCSSVAFAGSFRELGEAMFPGETFKPLPADHPICNNEDFPARLEPPPHVEELDNGARIQMLLLPIGDPAREWQTRSFPPIKHYTAGQLMMNVYLYAVDKQGLRSKGEQFIVKRRDDVKTLATAKVARLRFDGNWNPEPGGWRRLANILHNDNHLDITVEPVDLGKGLLSNAYALADLTGTDALQLTDEQSAELKKYVDGGGTLLVDAAGGKTAFAVSVTEQLNKAFPGMGTPDVLPPGSPVFAVGEPIERVSYRQFAHATLGILHTPRLRGFVRGNRVAVFLSNEDLTVGLVGQPVDGIIGYDPASATHLVQNVVLYATKLK